MTFSLRVQRRRRRMSVKMEMLVKMGMLVKMEMQVKMGMPVKRKDRVEKITIK